MLRQDFDELMRLYDSIKSRVRRQDPHLYERWKAGGFLVDNDIVSMYPSLEEVVDTLDEEVEDEEVEDEEEFLDEGPIPGHAM
jgi:hypothetical protein